MDVRPFPERVLDGIVRRGVRLPSALPPCALYPSLGGSGGIVPRRVGGEDHGGTMGGNHVIGGDERLCHKKIGGLALLCKRYRRFGRSARCSDVLSRVGRGGVECEARTLGVFVMLRRLSLAALGIDPKTLKASRTIDPLPLPSLDSAKGLSTVDWTSRPPNVRPWYRYLRSWQGAAAARRPRRLEVCPGVVPDVLERAVELNAATADDVSRL